MVNRSMLRSLCVGAYALLSMLAFHGPVHAAWKPRESADLLRAAPQESLQRAEVLYARLVPGAGTATKPRRETAADDSRRGTVEPDRATPAPMTATAAAPGQAGYVHYFLIHRPDGTAEMQVGIELPDQNIAWSFPGLGVAVSPFIESGSLTARDGKYGVQHLFGIRPFPDDRAMAALAHDIQPRVMPWVEDAVQHCDLDPPRREACVSCLGFVLRILFPGEFPSYPALPTDFKQARAGERYTTEDLLIYLTGLHTVATREARVGRINALDVPQTLREELLRVVSLEPTVPEAVPRSTVRGRASRSSGKGATPRGSQARRRL